MRDQRDQPAFPTVEQIHNNELGEILVPQGGLTKREWFAGLAMQNMIEPDCLDLTEEGMNKFCHALSWRSWRMADAMFEETPFATPEGRRGNE